MSFPRNASWDKIVYYQRECFSQEKGKEMHPVLLSWCRKCHWLLRGKRQHEVPEIHPVFLLLLLAFLLVVDWYLLICHAVYMYLKEHIDCFTPKMKMYRGNWAAAGTVKWFSGQIRLPCPLFALFFTFLLKLAALLEQLVKFLCYHFGWLLMIWKIRHICRLCWRCFLCMVKCVKGWIEDIASCISSKHLLTRAAMLTFGISALPGILTV